MALRILRPLLWVASLGLVAGTIEAAVRLVHAFVPSSSGWTDDLSPQILWIAPAFDLLLFLAIGGSILVASRVLPKRLTPRWYRGESLVWAAFGAFATYGAVKAIESAYGWRLYGWAVALLCLGVATYLYRSFGLVTPADGSLRRDLLRIGGLALLGPLAAAVLGAARRNEPRGSAAGLQDVLSLVLPRHHVQAAPAASTTRPPNVLLVVLDTLRADHLSAHGYARPTTPHLDSFARSGTLFENGISTAAWTPPSHASMFTGRYVFEHRADGRPLGPEYPTLAEFLAERGYATGAFVANLLQLTRSKRMDRGFQVWEDYYGNPVDAITHTVYGRLARIHRRRVGYDDVPGRKRAAAVNDQLLGWLEAGPAMPFFAFLNYFDVHDPFVPPPPYDRTFIDTPPGLNELTNLTRPELSEAERALGARWRKNAINGYDGSLAYLDAQLGALFERLQARGILDSTVVIVTSDHGEQFGNHGIIGHANSLYRELLHVPLLVRYPPSVPAATRVPCAASLRSIPATVLDLAGLTAGSPFPADSLSAQWSEPHGDAACNARVAFSELNRSRRRSLSTRHWHLLLDQQGKITLYNTERDPTEQQDLAATAEGKQAIASLGPHLQQLMPPSEWERLGPLVRGAS